MAIKSEYYLKVIEQSYVDRAEIRSAKYRYDKALEAVPSDSKSEGQIQAEITAATNNLEKAVTENFELRFVVGVFATEEDYLRGENPIHTITDAMKLLTGNPEVDDQRIALFSAIKSLFYPLFQAKLPAEQNAKRI